MSVHPMSMRPTAGVNLIRLNDGGEVHIDDIPTAEDGKAILEQLDEAILAIDGQLAHAGPRADRVWRIRAEMALKRKRRQRPALQHRIAELRRAERPVATSKPWSGHGSERREARRKAFINAAEELLPAETFTEIWARAAEHDPIAFAERASAA